MIYLGVVLEGNAELENAGGTNFREGLPGLAAWSALLLFAAKLNDIQLLPAGPRFFFTKPVENRFDAALAALGVRRADNVSVRQGMASAMPHARISPGFSR